MSSSIDDNITSSKKDLQGSGETASYCVISLGIIVQFLHHVSLSKLEPLASCSKLKFRGKVGDDSVGDVLVKKA